jgi:hypothetical protein
VGNIIAIIYHCTASDEATYLTSKNTIATLLYTYYKQQYTSSVLRVDVCPSVCQARSKCVACRMLHVNPFLAEGAIMAPSTL